MCYLQLRTLLFLAWVVGYIAFLLAIRRMWTGKYVRSPLARSFFMNMVSESEATTLETQEVCCYLIWVETLCYQIFLRGTCQSLDQLYIASVCCGGESI